MKASCAAPAARPVTQASLPGPSLARIAVVSQAWRAVGGLGQPWGSWSSRAVPYEDRARTGQEAQDLASSKSNTSPRSASRSSLASGFGRSRSYARAQADQAVRRRQSLLTVRWGIHSIASHKEDEMPSVTRQSQMDRAKDSLRDVVAYADEVIRDERLRADLAAAVRHGAKARNRVAKDIDAGGVTTRLASDRKLRKSLRAVLDDLDRASTRVRRKGRHDARRRVLVIVAGAGALLAAFPLVRRWLFTRGSGPASVSSGDTQYAHS